MNLRRWKPFWRYRNPRPATMSRKARAKAGGNEPKALLYHHGDIGWILAFSGRKMRVCIALLLNPHYHPYFYLPETLRFEQYQQIKLNESHWNLLGGRHSNKKKVPRFLAASVCGHSRPTPTQWLMLPIWATKGVDKLAHCFLKQSQVRMFMLSVSPLQTWGTFG